MYMFHIFIVQGADRCWSRALSADAIVENGQFTPGIAVVGYKDTCSISIKKSIAADAAVACFRNPGTWIDRAFGQSRLARMIP